MPTVTASTSPFSCRWIQRGTETRISNWSYALCVRLSKARLVLESECARCIHWEPLFDQDSSSAEHS
jgi:hypothetical protein